MLTSADEQQLQACTRRRTTADALAWIAEGRSIRGATHRELLPALLRAKAERRADADEAMRRVARTLLASTVDSSSSLLNIADVATPEQCDDALNALVQCSSGASLSSVDGASLGIAMGITPLAVIVYLQIAGMTWREAQRMADEKLPSSPAGQWTGAQRASVVRLVSSVVGGAGRGTVELMDPTARSWAAIDSAQSDGVTYGALLAQRLAGGAWTAHQSRTASALRRMVLMQVYDALSARDLRFSTTLTDRAETKSTTVLSSQVTTSGEPVGQVAFVVHHSNGAAKAAVLVAVAHDGGTARKTGATLLRAPSALTVPAYLVLAGMGWADRSESDALFEAYSGLVFTDTSTYELVAELAR